MKKRYKKPVPHGIAAIRKSFGYTQGQMANRLLISRSSLAMSERGLRNLPASALLKLAQMELDRLALKQAQMDIHAEDPACPMIKQHYHVTLFIHQ